MLVEMAKICYRFQTTIPRRLSLFVSDNKLAVGVYEWVIIFFFLEKSDYIEYNIK